MSISSWEELKRGGGTSKRKLLLCICLDTIARSQHLQCTHEKFDSRGSLTSWAWTINAIGEVESSRIAPNLGSYSVISILGQNCARALSPALPVSQFDNPFLPRFSHEETVSANLFQSISPELLLDRFVGSKLASQESWLDRSSSFREFVSLRASSRIGRLSPQM